MIAALGVLLPLNAKAYYVEIGDIRYNIVNELQIAKVAGNIYTGEVIIPESFTFEGVTYSVTSIGDMAFYGCSGLTSITIPNSVTSIGVRAFYGCSGLTSLTIPNSVTSIDGDAFSGCSALTSLTIPNSVTSIGGGAFSGCSGLTAITIPNSVTSIDGYAFSGCSGLTAITIPNSVTSIGERAFYGCSGLTSITIPNSVTTIGPGAFYNCSGLIAITIPSSVTNIGWSVFEGTPWYNNQPDGLVYAGNVAYKYKGAMPSNTTIALKEGTVGIAGAFYGCSGLTSITIPNSVTSIGNQAFSGCSGLTSITIPSSVTNIGLSAFEGCSGLTSITIPNSVTSIGNHAFRGCSGLTSITIPNSVTSIEDNAFYGCSGLTAITIPSSVTNIGWSAFEGCSGLTSVVSEIEEPFTFGKYAFYDIFSNCVLTVPYGTKDAYIAKGWTTDVFKGGIVEANPRCETPTIALANGKLTIDCATEGAKYVVHCSANFDGTLTENELNLPEVVGLTVSVYATAPNHENSETVTETFSWPMDLEGDLNGDGLVNISDVTKLVNMILGKE